MAATEVADLLRELRALGVEPPKAGTDGPHVAKVYRVWRPGWHLLHVTWFEVNPFAFESLFGDIVRVIVSPSSSIYEYKF
jgi:hypothetical protein